jgi:uncharacterized protein with von Willebrand factor type A (vWA) domain
VGFGRELRGAGLAVGVSEALDFVRALGLVDIAVRSDVKRASRAIHVRRRDDLALHDEVFEAYWSPLARRQQALADDRPSAHRAASPDAVAPADRVSQADARPSASSVGESDEGDARGVAVQRTYSAAELLRRRDFERMTPDELREAEKLIDELALNLAVRPARRFELHSHGTRLAPRPMLRRSIATGGELVEWLWSRPRVPGLCD